VKGVEGRFEKIRTEHPEFKGKTGLMASPYEGYFIYGSQDPRSRLLTDLGFTLPADLDKAIGDKFGANISGEKAALLDQQAVVWFPSKGGAAKLKADPVYKALKVAKQGRDVFIEENYDDQLYGATSFVSVCSASSAPCCSARWWPTCWPGTSSPATASSTTCSPPG
jgi:iron complex transport system substrate-binding protein